MPTPTYKPLANITLGSSAASVTFGSINQGFRDLVLIATGTITSPNDIRMYFNNTQSGYSFVRISGNGTTASSATSSGVAYVNIANSAYWSGTLSNSVIHMFDYSATDKYKTVLSRSNASSVGVEAIASSSTFTSAVTSLTIYPLSASFAAGSSFALYGVAA